MDSICLCGRQRSYPHAWDCPWPNFSGSERRDVDWMVDRDKLRESYWKAGLATRTASGWYYGHPMQKAAR